MVKKRGRPKGSKNKVSKDKVYGLVLGVGKRQRHTKPKRQRKPKLKLIRVREHELRPMIREAARAGLVEAIEHTHNFWSVGEGYKKYIDYQIKSQSDALMAAVKLALRQDRERRENARLRRKR